MSETASKQITRSPPLHSLDLVDMPIELAMPLLVSTLTDLAERRIGLLHDISVELKVEGGSAHLIFRAC